MRQRQLQWYEHEQREGSEEDVKHVTKRKTTRKKKRKSSNTGDLIL